MRTPLLFEMYSKNKPKRGPISDKLIKVLTVSLDMGNFLDMGPRLKKVGITIFNNNFSTMIPRKVVDPPPRSTTYPERGRNSYTDICMSYKRLKSLLIGWSADSVP
jgi:hypothetical protein